MDGLTEMEIRNAANAFATLCRHIDTLIMSLQPLAEILVKEAREAHEASPGYKRPDQP